MYGANPYRVISNERHLDTKGNNDMTDERNELPTIDDLAQITLIVVTALVCPFALPLVIKDE